MVSEETAKRIADELKRLADALERQKASFPLGQPIPAYDPTHCAFCGERHGGLSCPALKPMART